MLPLLTSCCQYYRNDKCGSATPSGAWIPHAQPARMSRHTLRDHAWMLAQGSDEATYLWDSAVETGGLLYHGGFRVQGGVVLLRARPPPSSRSPPAPALVLDKSRHITSTRSFSSWTFLYSLCFIRKIKTFNGVANFGDIGKSRRLVRTKYLKLIVWQLNQSVIPKVKGKIVSNTFTNFEEEWMMRRYCLALKLAFVFQTYKILHSKLNFIITYIFVKISTCLKGNQLL